ncbi:hypothetical protein B0H12DRAFT_166707 [Mycena haematopus]|nr:hypothetical protein B0H12DRAFT_166707 [Mycena haematopus]
MTTMTVMQTERVSIWGSSGARGTRLAGRATFDGLEHYFVPSPLGEVSFFCRRSNCTAGSIWYECCELCGLTVKCIKVGVWTGLATVLRSLATQTLCRIDEKTVVLNDLYNCAAPGSQYVGLRNPLKMPIVTAHRSNDFKNFVPVHRRLAPG